MNTATSTRNDLPSAEETSHFDPDQYLLGILRRAVAAEQNLAVSLPDVGEIRVLTTRGDYFSDLTADRMQQFCCRPAEQYSVRKLSEREIAGVLQTARPGRNIDELMWHAALCASKGRLLKGCRRDDVVLLKHWPNLTRLTATPNAVRIAALLTRYPTSVSLAYHLLKISQAELSDFYSAAHAAGWTVAVNRKPEITDESELKPHRSRGLLTLILNRIAGL
jgi:hypothetical protein